MPMHDFENILRKWLTTLKPKSILEYGPGLSTEIMLALCPEVHITSIEHDHHWYAKAKAKYKDRVNLVFRESFTFKSQYACWPLLQDDIPQYDFIFVDGRRRVECLLVGLNVLKPNGILLLHDAERKEYQHGIDLYETIEKHSGKDLATTVILKKRL